MSSIGEWLYELDKHIIPLRVIIMFSHKVNYMPGAVKSTIFHEINEKEKEKKSETPFLIHNRFVSVLRIILCIKKVKLKMSK